MDPTILTAAIAAGGVVLGAALSAIASAYAASRKTKEIELNHAHKMREKYLENARQFAGTIYVPLNIHLTKLSNAYSEFRRYVDFDKGTSPNSALENFRSVCLEVVGEINLMSSRGADAYLTTDFDQALNDFVNFIRQSVDETNVVRKRVLQMELNYPAIGMFPRKFERNYVRNNLRFFVPDISIRVGGIKLGYSEDQVISAPLTSREFEKRIQTEVPTLKFLIKEVTLGTQISKGS